MKTEIVCEKAANHALKTYVEYCECNSVVDLVNAIDKMIAVAAHARDLVLNGKMETVQ